MGLRAGGSLTGVLALVAACVVPTVSAAQPRADRPTVRTDGRLRPGHLESIRIRGFPGRGVAEVSFFPTAICEAECSVPVRFAGRTNGAGAAHSRVRIPNGFYNSQIKFTPFRNHERVNVDVTWIGPGEDEFARASAHPDPIIVRVHRGAERIGPRPASGSCAESSSVESPERRDLLFVHTDRKAIALSHPFGGPAGHHHLER